MKYTVTFNKVSFRTVFIICVTMFIDKIEKKIRNENNAKSIAVLKVNKATCATVAP